jgi:SprT protein
MEQLERNKAILNKYIPANAVPVIAGWIFTYDFKLKIKRARTTKYGDYRPPFKGLNHQITINHDLNKYAFLNTLVHEIAHLSAWKKYGDKIQSHGKEWKQEYRLLLHPFLHEGIFPTDIISALKEYLHNPAATVCTDKKLFKILRKYDGNNDGRIFLDELPLQSQFIAEDSYTYLKQKKIRTRYLCTRINTRHEYLFHGTAQVKPVLKETPVYQNQELHHLPNGIKYSIL